MNRTTYLLKDPFGVVQARMTLPEGETATLEPWMIDSINQRGWYLDEVEAPEGGIPTHGWADWKAVADDLASVMAIMLEDGRESSEAEDEEILTRAQAALDRYAVAQMEVNAALASAAEDGDDGGDSET